MYNEKQLFAANPIDRYAIGDRDKLTFNPNGSLDLGRSLRGTSITTIGGGLIFRWGWMLRVGGRCIRLTGAG
jgi:hypothetical protein